MPFVITIKDVGAKALRLQDAKETDPDPDPNADEVYAFGFVLLTTRQGDFRGDLIPIPKSTPVKFRVAGEEHWLDSSGIRMQQTVNEAPDGTVFHPFMILMEEDTGSVAGDVEEAIQKLIKDVLPSAERIGALAEDAIELAEVQNGLIFIGALTDWVLSTFNSDDFLGKLICNRVDVSNLGAGSSVSTRADGILEGGNAKYKFWYDVEVERV